MTGEQFNDLAEKWREWKFSGSHDKPRLLWEAYQSWFEDVPVLDVAGYYRQALIEAYQGRNINMGGDLGPRQWLALFRYAGFVSDQGQAPPAEPLTIYRGMAPPYRATAPAWTTDRDVAWWFANRHREGAVWEATVQPRHVLALLWDFGESEVVVSPFAPPLRDWVLADHRLRVRYPARRYGRPLGAARLRLLPRSEGAGGIKTGINTGRIPASFDVEKPVSGLVTDLGSGATKPPGPGDRSQGASCGYPDGGKARQPL